MKVNISFFFSILFAFSGFTQSSIKRIDPPNWWTGMKTNQINLLVHGSSLNQVTEVTFQESLLRVTGFKVLENPAYLLVSLEIDPACKPGTYPLTMNAGKKKLSFPYELKEREKIYPDNPPVDQSDNIYLIMPDRFCNGNPSNDKAEGFSETCFNRDSAWCRHGGDLAGIAQHLSYVKELGMTAIWLNPVQENNQPDESYHGYAITDHYRIDPRLGTLQEYTQLSRQASKDSLKLIMDVVLNHVGNGHYLYKNPPASDWFHRFPEFTRTNYRSTVLADPYASETDRKRMQNGWFDKHMPDLNQKNPLVESYLTQNILWWIETARLKGLRVDTWAYSDPEFAQRWIKAIRKEYPLISIFGEVWEHGAPFQAWFTAQSKVNAAKTELPGITDFQFYYSINEIVGGINGWTQGLNRMYYALAQDFLYRDPSKLVVFVDNHDLTRFYTQCGKDFRKFKVGMVLLYTLRGWPVLLYGSELLMDAAANPDARVRLDLPGGWKEDKINKFSKSGRSEEENLAFDLIQKLAEYRKRNAFMQNGKLVQFLPENGVYVYARTDGKKTALMVVSANDKAVELDLSRFKEVILEHNSGMNVLNGAKIELSKSLQVQPWDAMLIELN